MIVAESIGFSATHSISEILSEVPGYEVSHGSQHFVEKCPIGQGSQSVNDFIDSMAASDAAGNRAVAVHTLFPPQDLKPVCQAAGGDYWLLVREPVAQIESCFAWISNGVLSGNPGHFQHVLKASLAELARIGAPVNLPNACYYYAMNHVLSYNLVALGMETPVRRMEDLLSDEAAFRAAFAVPETVEIPHFQGDEVHRASHRSEKKLQAMADPDREALQAGFQINLAGRNYGLQIMERLLGYAA